MLKHDSTLTALADELTSKLEIYHNPKTFKKNFKATCKKLDKTRKISIDEKLRKVYRYSKFLVNKLQARVGKSAPLPLVEE